MTEVRDITRKGAVDELIAEVLRVTSAYPGFGVAMPATDSRLRQIAIAAPYEPVSGQQPQSKEILASSPKAPD